MSTRTRRFLTGASLTAAIAVVFLLFYMGEPGPVDPPVLPATITVLFGVTALLFAILTRPGEASEAPDGSESQNWGWTPSLIVFALTVTGLGLRLAYLDKFWLSNDEVLFVFAAGHESFADALRDSLTHFHPPTNFILLHYLLKVSWDPVWIRLPAVLGGTLAIGGVYLFVRSLWGTLAGLLAAFFTTFSPNLILLSQVCRNYSPSLPFLLLSLYFLARYLRERRPWLLYGFAALEFMAVAWHYALLPAFLGANLILFYVVFRGEAALRNAARAVLAQVPVGVLYVSAVLFHLPITQGGQRGRVVGFMVEEFNFDPTNPLRQLLALFKYLVADYPDVISMMPTFLFLVAALLGAFRLGRLGLGRQVALCVAFLPFAYFFAFGLKLLPFGGTRHSFYAFPFLFALVSGFAALAVVGQRQFLEGAGGSAPDAEGNRGIGGSRTAAVVLALLCTGFVWDSLRHHLDTTPYLLRRSPVYRERMVYYKADAYKAVELPTRVEDVDAVSHFLLARSVPGETVQAALPSFMMLRSRLVSPPHSVFFDLETTRDFSWRERRFVYVRGSGLGFTPDTLFPTIVRLARDEGLKDDDRVWVAIAGWDVWSMSLRDWTKGAYPGTVAEFGDGSYVDDMVFPVNVGAARHYAWMNYGIHRNFAPACWAGLRAYGFQEMD